MYLGLHNSVTCILLLPKPASNCPGQTNVVAETVKVQIYLKCTILELKTCTAGSILSVDCNGGEKKCKD